MSLLNQAAQRFDRVMRRALLQRSARARARSRAESLGHPERLEALRTIAEIYDRPEHFDDPSSFFPRCPIVEPSSRVVGSKRFRTGERAEVIDVSWRSDGAAFCADVGPAFTAHPENARAAARLFAVAPTAGHPPRPFVMLVHGYRAGQFAIEERVWPVTWLLRRGFDVALAVLPFHAARSPKGRGPLFPSSDPRFTNEGFRQAMTDLWALSAIGRQRGAPAVGIMGMSLGGYATALFATLEPDLAFAVPIIPVASLADMALRGERLVGTDEEQALQHAALEAAHRVISPLARPSALPPERVLVVGAEGDDITPIDHARRLAEHFHAPLETFSGGHILQFGRAGAFRRIGLLFRELGLPEDGASE